MVMIWPFLSTRHAIKAGVEVSKGCDFVAYNVGPVANGFGLRVVRG